ncbi:MAG: terpene cyclase/mutase family protein [Planctomycetes bacterium]|nr:terpene cyclase/mutase family protein [Planctomycetota bacterium]
MNKRMQRLTLLLALGVGITVLPLATLSQEKKKGKLPVETNPFAEDPQKLLAERDRKKGPTSPGIDPAFLVLPRPSERNTISRDLLTDDVRALSNKALEFLAKSQESDGGWSDTQFTSNTGVTALCVLAFMAEGSRPRMGKFGRQIDRGLEFLLKNAQTSGVIVGKGSNPYGPGYEHALSTLALLLGYGDMPWRPETKDVLSKAVQVILRSQHLDGGWRYQMSREGLSDMSVTANVLWVLRVAKKAGFTVPRKAIEEGVKFVEQCAMPDGHFRYRTFGLQAAPSLGGTGVIALSNHGDLDHKLIAPARDKIAYEYQRYTVEDLKEQRFIIFGCFYASLAMYSCGDTFFVPWFKKCVEVLTAMQRKDGEFPDQTGNIMYTTAMAAMILQAPLGYLPLYER